MNTILLADDSWIARMKIGKSLESAGYKVIEAANGVEALSAIDLHTPALIILDLLMPEMDGTEVLRRLRGTGSAIPVIVITADIQDITRETCFSLGAAAVINKPPELIRTDRRITTPSL